MVADKRFLTGRGASTAIAWRAAFFSRDYAGVALLGGIPEGDWVDDADNLVAPLVATPSLYYAIGKLDEEYAAAADCFSAVTGTGVVGLFDEQEGLSADAVLDFTSIWHWLDNNS